MPTPATKAEQAKVSESSAGKYTGLIKQVQSEQKVAYDFMVPRWNRQSLWLRLLANQRKDKNSVGDNTLFTIFDTVMSDLYSDTLEASFTGRSGESDRPTTNNLTILAKYDHDEMEKAKSDYYWNWEALFFGRGLLMMSDFDREQMAPIPEVWRVMATMRDPDALSVNGLDRRGRGRARYIGRQIPMTLNEMEEMGVYFNFKDLKPNRSSTSSLIEQNLRLQNDVFGDNYRIENPIGENGKLQLLEWFTVYQGKRVFVTLADDMKRVVRYQEYDSLFIPIIDRAVNPNPYSWEGVPVPQLIEDKQRAKAKTLNLAIRGVESAQNPMYLYDQLKIKDRSHLNFGFNKMIPTDGSPRGAVEVMPKETLKQEVAYILDTLANNAERATATPSTKQGVDPSGQNTATRDVIVDQGSDKRYGLAAKIFGWSERAFWVQWYNLYKEHFNEGIDEKIVRISGPLGEKWRPLTRENLITDKKDPDVKVESRVVAEARRFNQSQQFQAYFQFIASDPTANLRFALRYMGQLQNIDTDVLEQLLPPTPDELMAAEENEVMLENPQTIIPVLPEQDHMAHIAKHAELPDTPALRAHIKAHNTAMALQQQRPDLFPGLGTADNSGVKDENVALAGSGASGGNRPVLDGGFGSPKLPTS